MSDDDYTRPERASEISMARRKWEKRYKSVKEKKGLCCFCIHRDREQTFWGRNVCRIGQQRMHDQCEKDGKGLRFEVDAIEVDKLKDAA